MASGSRYNLTKARLLHLLNQLKTNSSEAGSMCVPPGSSKTAVESMLNTVLDMNGTPADISESISESPTGAMLFWGPEQRYLVMPPFPLAGDMVLTACEIEPLYSLMNKEFLLGLVMVRLGEYAIGVFQGEKLLTGKKGTGLVHARHRQGGSSANRFVRHREKQMETFFTRVCLHAREQMEPYVKQLDYVVYGGSRETILEFRRQCGFLHEFDSRTLDRLLNVREPKQSGLAEGIQEAWSSRVFRW